MSKSFAHSLLLQGRQCLRNGTDDKPLNINHNHNAHLGMSYFKMSYADVFLNPMSNGLSSKASSIIPKRFSSKPPKLFTA
ncbi:hypothetical protein VIDI103191_20495 [Vibrio diazotrophicus]